MPTLEKPLVQALATGLPAKVDLARTEITNPRNAVSYISTIGMMAGAFYNVDDTLIPYSEKDLREVLPKVLGALMQLSNSGLPVADEALRLLTAFTLKTTEINQDPSFKGGELSDVRASYLGIKEFIFAQLAAGTLQDNPYETRVMATMRLFRERPVFPIGVTYSGEDGKGPLAVGPLRDDDKFTKYVSKNPSTKPPKGEGAKSSEASFLALRAGLNIKN